MWFSFGLVSLFVIFSYRLYSYINANWSGDSATTNGFAYEYKKRKYKNSMHSLLISIAAPNGYEYRLKKETAIDRFFKRIGISKEHQSGHIIFDDMVYIASDNAHFNNLASQSREMTDAIVKIFRAIENKNCKPAEIVHCNGKLWVEIKTKGALPEDKIFDFMPGIVEQLKIVANEIENAKTNTLTSQRDHFRLKAAIFLALTSGLAINGAVQLFRISFGSIPFITDTSQLIGHAIAIGLVATIVLLILARYLLDGSARTHLVILDILLTGTFGTCSTAFAELRDLNIEMDKSTVIIHERRVQNMYISHHRKSPDTYKIVVAGLDNKQDTELLQISYSLYSALNVGDSVNILQKAGYLGYPWVNDITKTRTSTSNR